MNGSSHKTYLTIIAILVALLGAMMGHITTKDGLTAELDNRYILRAELKPQLDRIQIDVREIRQDIKEIRKGG